MNSKQIRNEVFSEIDRQIENFQSLQAGQKKAEIEVSLFYFFLFLKIFFFMFNGGFGRLQ